jgi:hypothetical protein
MQLFIASRWARHIQVTVMVRLRAQAANCWISGAQRARTLASCDAVRGSGVVGLGWREADGWGIAGGDGDGIEVGVGAMSMAWKGGL